MTRFHVWCWKWGDAGRYLFTPLEKMLRAWLSHPSHMCCGGYYRAGSVSVLWLLGRKVNRAKLLLPAVSDHSGCISAVVRACWERGSSCTVTSLLQCLRIINACQLVGGLPVRGKPWFSCSSPVCWQERGVGLYLAHKLDMRSYLDLTTVIW